MIDGLTRGRTAAERRLATRAFAFALIDCPLHQVRRGAGRERPAEFSLPTCTAWRCLSAIRAFARSADRGPYISLYHLRFRLPDAWEWSEG